VSISRLSWPARAAVTALVVAGVAIVVQIIAGANYPAIPPGLIIVLASALVLFIPWRWTPLNGVLAGGFLFFGGVKAAGSRYDLTRAGHPGVFAGTWIDLRRHMAARRRPDHVVRRAARPRAGPRRAAAQGSKGRRGPRHQEARAGHIGTAMDRVAGAGHVAAPDAAPQQRGPRRRRRAPHAGRQVSSRNTP
jgi:hypothetical protein